MEKVRVALVGCGVIANAMHLPGIKTMEEMEKAEDDNSLLLLDFGDARFAFLDATYCVMASMGPRTEIYGSEGTIAVGSGFLPRSRRHGG